ncbi:hypothetical protein HELRODRAFT_166919 [Helobdella robusta]|uniref:Uncharacterized protein n=1 Tax=Helobdella robusta TaxID=6412 RepID=T1EYR2_HELRO|nr:hypothetical protein HELRODRAFT_166919 [Helobdella robusta]ESO11848.1 hypothetical protein HELRODRAFT_166919 [Helobdella robusta]
MSKRYNIGDRKEIFDSSKLPAIKNPLEKHHLIKRQSKQLYRKQLYKILALSHQLIQLPYNYISDCKSIIPTDDFDCEARVNCDAPYSTTYNYINDRKSIIPTDDFDCEARDNCNTRNNYDAHVNCNALDNCDACVDVKNEVDYLNGKNVIKGGVNANVHSGYELVTGTDSSFEIIPSTCTWKESLIPVYLDITDVFFGEKNEICIAQSC